MIDGTALIVALLCQCLMTYVMNHIEILNCSSTQFCSCLCSL